jgi:hypothetical protein
MELVSDEVAAQVVDTLKEKTMQVQVQEADLRKKLQMITKEVEDPHRS